MNVSDLLSAFNDNIQSNIQLINYLARPNVFETIGKARNELVHSKMIEHILISYHQPDNQESPLVHLLDILIKRAEEQGNNTIPEELRNAVLSRSLPAMNLVRHGTEIPLSAYRKGCNSDGRLDVFMEFAMSSPLEKDGCTSIKIFLENKALSHEHDSQTTSYYNTCKNSRGESCYTLFVYLTPLTSRELDEYTSLSDEEKPECRDFISINYQDILNSVIEPLITIESLDKRNRVILTDYVSCLELPALTDDVKTADMSIMATSTHERNLVNEFLKNQNNRKLIDLVINYKTRNRLFSVMGEGCMTFNDALEHSLSLFINDIKESYADAGHDGELEVLDTFKGVVSAKNNGTPFLVYSPDGKQYVKTTLYEYDGRVFNSFKKALGYAVLDFQSRKNLNADDTIHVFSAVYGNRHNGNPLLSKEVGSKYGLISSHIGMRRDVTDSVISRVNDVLDSPITVISPESFHDLLISGKYVDFLECFNECQYQRIMDTRFYYRKGMEKKYETINSGMRYMLDEVILSSSEKTLLENFYNSHKSLIQSVLKISVENESDNELYIKGCTTLKTLMKA